jgi:heme/copper-type cytochrome/quinol oxidase subunit 2
MTTQLRTTGKAAQAAVIVAGVLLALAGCESAPPAPPTTVVVTTPPADGGMAVLLTVVIALAVLALIGAAAFACAWSHERRSRREAENTVYALTGHRSTHAAVTVAPDVARLLALDPNRTTLERPTR